MHYNEKSNHLFLVLTGIFIASALMAEFIGVKIFALETTLGIQPFNWNLFGQSGSLNFTAGVMLWPMVFILTDIVNEYFGHRGVRFISWLTVVLIVYAFLFAYLSIRLSPAPWWVGVNASQGVPDNQAAFAAIFGQGLWTIAGSVTAFMIGQLVDVGIFHSIRRVTGEKKLWLRATGSTLVSQLIDSFVVLYIAFVLGPQHWSMSLFLAVATVNYVYKFLVAILATPIVYLVHEIVERWLGHEAAHHLKEQAARN